MNIKKKRINELASGLKLPRANQSVASTTSLSNKNNFDNIDLPYMI